MKRKWLYVTLGLIAGGLTSKAQHPLTYTQHGQLRTSINPAASLLEQDGAITLIGRRQWVGIEGAPSVIWGSGHVGLGRTGATVGLSVRHESLAVEKLTEASAFFAKGVRISETEYLGFALNAGMSYMEGNYSGLDPIDPTVREDIRETDVLVGFGIMLYRPDRYYVGLSLPRLMFGNLGLPEDSRYNFHNVYHLTAGALFSLDTDFQFRPSILITYSESLRPMAELSALFFVRHLFGIGLNIRSYGDLAGMAQLNIGGLGIGYSYQFNPKNRPLNRTINNSSHEIGLSYRFGSRQVLL